MALKGHIAWNKGKKMSLEEKAKLNMEGLKKGRGWFKGTKGLKNGNTKGNKYPFKERPKAKGRKIWNKGLKMSEDFCKKISDHNKKVGKIPPSQLGNTGSKSGSWKGGIYKSENIKIRSSFEYTLWRKACMERDNFTCQKTGQRGGRLEVHHINNFADFKELRTSIENGITLSKKSHELFHKIYGKKNNTKEQLLEFLKNRLE